MSASFSGFHDITKIVVERPEVLPLYGTRTFTVQRMHVWQGDAKHTVTLYLEEGALPLPSFGLACKEENEK